MLAMIKLKSCFVLLTVVAALTSCSTGLPQSQTAQTQSVQASNLPMTPFNYDSYAELLKTYVNEAGFVDYHGLQADAALKPFNRSLGEVTPERFASWNESDQIAYLINAYNAFTLESIIDQKPLKSSIREIPGVWRVRKFQIAGQSKTLDDIEHKTLRKDYQEPRIHAALNCTAISCPPLRREPYTGEKLNEQLDDQVRRWLNSSEGLKIDRSTNQVAVSALFKWFGEDWTDEYAVESGFTGNQQQRAFLNFISKYVSPEDQAYLIQGGYRLSYLDYNWTLNRQ